MRALNMSVGNGAGLPPVTIRWNQVFSSDHRAETEYMSIPAWNHPVTFFVGPNGTGKSRTAKAISEHVGNSRFLSTDRLFGITSMINYGSVAVPEPQGFRGLPLGPQERAQSASYTRGTGTATEELYALREQPEVALRVAAFIRSTLGRVIDLRETSGFLDPHVRMGAKSYSLLREEGHGLRELVVLLTATYRQDWTLLIVDEPELHLHPSMTRLWLAELRAECEKTQRKSIVVTHEPAMLKSMMVEDLDSVYLFSADRPPSAIKSHIWPEQVERVTASLIYNPHLISSLVFSPRPVLVEGVHDVAALSATLARTEPTQTVAQTDLIECGGSGGVALWFEISRRLGLNVRGIADLDAFFDAEVQRAMDASLAVQKQYSEKMFAQPPRTSTVLKPLTDRMGQDGVASNPKARGAWLAGLDGKDGGDAARRTEVLEIWRNEGLWLHPQGHLENVLGLEKKSINQAAGAAATPGPIDNVAAWAAYSLDPLGDVLFLLEAAVMRIAHRLMEALRVSPGSIVDMSTEEDGDAQLRLVEVIHQEGESYRLVVLAPEAFRGYWVNVSPDSRSSELRLSKPEGATEANEGGDD